MECQVYLLVALPLHWRVAGSFLGTMRSEGCSSMRGGRPGRSEAGPDAGWAKTCPVKITTLTHTSVISTFSHPSFTSSLLQYYSLAYYIMHCLSGSISASHISEQPYNHCPLVCQRYHQRSQPVCLYIRLRWLCKLAVYKTDELDVEMRRKSKENAEWLSIVS